MNKLTAEKCRERIASLKRNRRVFGLAMDSELYLQALEIALPVLEQNGGWISCSEQTPDAGQTVLVTNIHIHASEVAIYTQGSASGKYYFGASSGKFIATHWRHMPELPDIETQPSTNTQVDNDGWIEWKGGECPIPAAIPVEVKFRKGSTNRKECAGDWGWLIDDDEPRPYDIIAYRVIQEQPTNQNGEQ